MKVKTGGNALWKIWQNFAQNKPRKIVLIQNHPSISLTAAELTQRAAVLADEQLSGCSGRTVAYAFSNSIDWVILFLALQKVGAAALPLDASLSGEVRNETAKKLGAHFLWSREILIPLSAQHRKRLGASFIKVSSGSTGEIKPIPCSASHLIADGTHIIKSMGLRATDRNLAIIPLGHSYGLGNLVMPLLLQGTSLVCIDAFLPNQISQWIKQYKITLFPAVPAIFKVMADLPSTHALKPLRLAISAGAPLAADIAQSFWKKRHVKIHNLYGASETGSICYDRSGQASLTGRGVGKPLAGVQVTIHQGRIRVKSPAVATPKSTFILGDQGEWNRYGEITLLGRKQPMVNIGGKKVNPLEVEKTFRALPEVTDAWISVNHERGRDFMAAALETNLTRHELEKKFTEKLAHWKFPRLVHVSIQLPRTARGKLDVSKIKALLRLH